MKSICQNDGYCLLTIIIILRWISSLFPRFNTRSVERLCLHTKPKFRKKETKTLVFVSKYNTVLFVKFNMEFNSLVPNFIVISKHAHGNTASNQANWQQNWPKCDAINLFLIFIKQIHSIFRKISLRLSVIFDYKILEFVCLFLLFEFRIYLLISIIIYFMVYRLSIFYNNWFVVSL